jgi:hypothetical protein
VPLVQHYFPTRIKGISNRDAGYNHTVRMDALREATLEFGWDFAPPNGLAGHDGYEALASKQFRWPGGDLPDDAGFQFVEDEYLRADEVDAFLADPNGFTLTTILPRIYGGLEGLGQMPLPPLYWFSNMYNLQSVGGPMLTAPPLRKALESLLALSDAVGALNAAVGSYSGQMAGMGYPVTWGVATIPAFDMVSDTLRSLRGSTLDIFRQPEKLLAMIDLMQVPAVATAVMGAKMLGNPRIFIPMHRGAAGFMSHAQFERFYWPTFVALVEALLAESMVPMPLFEGDYTPRLKYLAHLPRARSRRTSTASTTGGSRRSAARPCASGATCRTPRWPWVPRNRSRRRSRCSSTSWGTGSSSMAWAASPTRPGRRTSSPCEKRWTSTARTEAVFHAGPPTE